MIQKLGADTGPVKIVDITNKLIELIAAYNKLSAEALTEVTIKEHQKNRGAMTAIFDGIVSCDNKARHERLRQKDAVSWLNFYCAAFNKTGEAGYSEYAADEALKLFKLKFPDKEVDDVQKQ